MSKDIRSFFTVLPKKGSTTSSTSKTKTKRPIALISDDEDDILPSTPEQPLRKKPLVVSDSDEEITNTKRKQAKKTTTPKPNLAKLKPVNPKDVFQSTPIKQSDVKVTPKVEKSEEKPKKKQKKGKKATAAEAAVHNDKKFEQTLIQLDDSDDEAFFEAIDQIEQPKISRKRVIDESVESTPTKKPKIEHKDSGFDDGEKTFIEKKKRDSISYQKFLNRSGPRLHGLKEPPKGGKSNCLANLCFVRTGVLESLEQDEFNELIKKYGGRTVSGVSKKVDYIVVGDEAGRSKLEKAENYRIQQIDENELFDLILTKSGLPARYVAGAKDADGFSLGGTSDEFVEAIKSTQKSPPKAQTSPLKKREIVPQKRPQTDDSKLPFWQKYKPGAIDQIIGQQANVTKLKKWLDAWHRNQKPEIRKKIARPSPWARNDDGAFYKCALLSGPPGVGKTTTANLVAKQLGLDVVEFNASDTRSKRLLHEHVGQLLASKTIASYAGKGEAATSKRVLIMDEVDGMSGNEDRGGMQELIQLIKGSKVPIICICNDRNHQKIRSLVNYCFDLRFSKPSAEQISVAFRKICDKENLKMSNPALMQIIAGTGCDIRQSLNHLSLWALSDKEISIDSAKKSANLAKKDIVLGPWETVAAVFTESNKNMNINERLGLFFYDYSIGPLFVQENYLGVQPSGLTAAQTLKRAAKAAHAISTGDYLDSQMRKTNNWSLLSLAGLHSSVLPGYYMSGHIKSKINFPMWLGNNSKKNKFSRLASEIQNHTRLSINTSKMAIQLDYLVPLRDTLFAPLLKNGKDGVERAVELLKSYNLRREDLDSLVELAMWQNKRNPMDRIEPKVKAALTRLYNKEVAVLPYSVSSKKKKATGDEFGDENEGESEVEEDDDDLTNNPMIKKKTAVVTGKGKKGENAGPSTSKKAEPRKRAPAKKK